MLDRAKRMFDAFAPDAEDTGPSLETSGHPVEPGLILTPGCAVIGFGRRGGTQAATLANLAVAADDIHVLSQFAVIAGLSRFVTETMPQFIRICRYYAFFCTAWTN